MATDEAYLEVLSRAECLQLLPTVPVGWIAYSHASRPRLVPVNFVVHRDEVMARTSYGSKLAAAAYELVMSFGVADTDPSSRTGWSVTVTGRARLIGDIDDLDLAGITFDPLEAWAPGDKDFYIGIRITEISGRRITTPPARQESRSTDVDPSSGSTRPTG